MDELTMIRDLLGEPAPPRPEVTAAARARVAGDGTRRPARPRTGRRRLASIAAPLGAAAAVTAVAVVLASLPHARAVPDGRATATAPGASQPSSGRYWVQPGVVGNYILVGQGSDRYSRRSCPARPSRRR
jgi:hypothetical protein